VGENGSGKTTLIKLLCRLYDPVSGSITLDDIDLRQFETSALRREITVIFQDYVKYHLTAQENIWFGNIEVPNEKEEIMMAACYADAENMIAKLPKGYDTILGKWFEDGEELSVGEWQKVALARAFMRNAQISRGFGDSWKAALPFWSAIAFLRCAWPTASLCSMEGALRRAVHMTSCFGAAGSTLSCLKSRQSRIDKARRRAKESTQTDSLVQGREHTLYKEFISC